jgi:hypothetical protein
MTPRVEGFAKCGCGRSPSGQCVGWHGIPLDEWNQTKDRLIEEYNKENDDKSIS